jgi:predicted nucleotidyltransferase
MNVARPYTAISATIDTSVLVSLAGSREPRSGRELARRIERSPTGVQHVLDRLVDEGLVERVPAGNALLYTLNYDHLLATAVQEMAGARVELVRRLRELVEHWEVEPVHVSLFGSAARGDGDVHSDIDLLVVRRKNVQEEDASWRAQVEHLAESVYRWTGNDAGIVELSQKDLPELRKKQPPVLREVNTDAINIAGTPARKLLGRN